jgi:hypothetical protein
MPRAGLFACSRVRVFACSRVRVFACSRVAYAARGPVCVFARSRVSRSRVARLYRCRRLFAACNIATSWRDVQVESPVPPIGQIAIEQGKQSVYLMWHVTC